MPAAIMRGQASLPGQPLAEVPAEGGHVLAPARRQERLEVRLGVLNAGWMSQSTMASCLARGGVANRNVHRTVSLARRHYAPSAPSSRKRG